MPEPATIAELTARIRAFADARDWRQFHNPKNLALALTGEVGELAAELQWLPPEEAAQIDPSSERAAAIRDELADIAIYLLRLADELGIDLANAISGKLERNEDRYPSDAVFGRSDHRPEQGGPR